MCRLIDEDAVKRRMHETMDYQDLYLPIHFEMCMSDAPTVDAVEVVRCGECRYRIRHVMTDDLVFCSKPYTERGNAVHRADWYCADGERMVQE